MRDFYYFGVEIEIIAEPRVHDSSRHKRTHYYEKLARALRREDLSALADRLDERYRKHNEHYDKWWITKDGSLGNPSYPDSMSAKSVFLHYLPT